MKIKLGAYQTFATQVQALEDSHTGTRDERISNGSLVIEEK